MKMQFLIIKEILKKNWGWFLLNIILVCLTLVLYIVNSGQSGIGIVDYYVLIGYPQNDVLSSIQTLLVLYNIGISVYISTSFYMYEINNSFENIILRISAKKWLITKIIFYMIFIFVFAIIRSYILYLFFRNKIDFNLSFILIPFFYNAFIFLFIITIINNCKFTRTLGLLIVFFVSTLIYYMYDNFIVLAFCILFIVFNIILFNFRKLLN